MRIPARDFYTIIGSLMIVIGIATPFIPPSDESTLICTAGGLIIGIPLLVFGLRLQSKYSQAFYGDNRLVKYAIWGILIGLLLAYLLIRCSVN